MFRPRQLLLVPALLLLVAAKQRIVPPPGGWPQTARPADAFSVAQPTQVVIRHLALDLTVDFEAQQVRGSARLDIDNLTGTKVLRLDTWGLEIERVTLDDGSPALWSLGEQLPLDRPLDVGIAPTTRSVTIEYHTVDVDVLPGDNIRGLQWNTAAATVGRGHPFVWAQNEPIAARSWMPVQDTPSVRMTYEATLHVPRDLMALMTAPDNPRQVNDTGVYRFHMPFTIPAYLIVFAAGNLRYHAFDERTGVYAEPELIDAAAWDLRYLPDMLDAAERVAGRFPFPRHDVMLPPPHGNIGMENPMLNFLDPLDVVTGDFAANPEPNAIVAHEIAHSWAGDATTLGSWQDVWLNEGLASYLTLRILEEMEDTHDALRPDYIELRWFSDRKFYEDSVPSLGEGDSVLHRDVPSPRSGFNIAGYWKGQLFFKTLEDRLGRARFDSFLQRYFSTFAWRWVNDAAFLDFFRRSVVRGDAGLEADLRLDEWIYAPGLPSNVTAATSSELDLRVRERAAAFAAGTPIRDLDTGSWSEVETKIFLSDAASALGSRLEEVDAALGLSAWPTPPFIFLRESIRARYAPGTAAAERVLLAGAPYTWIGRLYSELAAVDGAKARELYERARANYIGPVDAAAAQALGISASSLPAGTLAVAGLQIRPGDDLQQDQGDVRGTGHRSVWKRARTDLRQRDRQANQR